MAHCPWLVEINAPLKGGVMFRLYVYDHETGKLAGRAEVPSGWAYRLLVQDEGVLTDDLFKQLEEPRA